MLSITNPPASAAQERGLIILAFGVVYIVWGSTYLANYVAIQSIPPFLMSGARFFVSGLILFGYTLWQGAPWPRLREVGNAVLMGILFLAIGTGAVVWAVQYIDTSLAALLVAFDPLLIMALLWLLVGQRPPWISWLGAAISIGGIVLLVGQPRLSGSRETIQGLLAIGLALVSWALASIYISRVALPQSRFRSTALQMLGGGTVLLAFSALTGDAAQFDPTALELRSVYAWLYLVFFGGILAFSCFTFLLSRVSPEKVATSTYVNPVVAVILGWSLNNEVITTQTALAGLLLLTGVFFINRPG
jgi:drug/metabolite transporter (DMT)-like permease